LDTWLLTSSRSFWPACSAREGECLEMNPANEAARLNNH
jgi:hypothetical protein